MESYWVRLIDENEGKLRIHITLPFALNDYLKETFNDIKMGVDYTLMNVYGLNYVTRIKGLVELGIFKNPQAAILFAITNTYLKRNKIILGE